MDWLYLVLLFLYGAVSFYAGMRYKERVLRDLAKVKQDAVIAENILKSKLRRTPGQPK